MNAVRRAIESQYKGLCTVKVWDNVTDPISKITTPGEKDQHINQPCKLSYEKQTTATKTVGPAVIVQTIKLFIAPELNIPPGSKIIVTQNNKTTEFSRSGEPAVYTHHQEITLELFKGYA